MTSGYLLKAPRISVEICARFRCDVFDSDYPGHSLWVYIMNTPVCFKVMNRLYEVIFRNVANATLYLSKMKHNKEQTVCINTGIHGMW